MVLRALTLAFFLAVLCGLFFWLWFIAPEENKVFNYALLVGVMGTLLLTAALIPLTIWLARRQAEQGHDQLGMLRRLVTKVELEPKFAVTFLVDGTETDRLELRPEWADRAEAGVVVEELNRRALMSETRYRPASDLQKVRVRVANDGPVPATGLLATFRLPERVEAFDDAEFYTSSMMSGLAGNIPIVTKNSWGLDVPMLDDIESFDERRDRSRFECWAKELGNHKMLELDPVWLRFPQSGSSQTYQIACEIVADGQEPFAKALTIVVLSD